METLAPTRSERGAAMAQDCIGPRLYQIERAVALEIASRLSNADAMEQALDDIGDLRRWPRFCAYMTIIVAEDPPPEARDAAINAVRRMLAAAEADRALATVMADLGVR